MSPVWPSYKEHDSSIPPVGCNVGTELPHGGSLLPDLLAPHSHMAKPKNAYEAPPQTLCGLSLCRTVTGRHTCSDF